MLKSLRVKLLILVFGIIAISSAIILVFIKHKTEENLNNAYNQYATNQLNLVLQNVSDKYRSIQYHKDRVLAYRKKDLKEKVEIVLASIDKYYSDSKNGVLTASDAKKKAADEISKIFYDNKVGYFWINNTQRPYPKMIMHPTIPELNGKVLDDHRFNCALGVNANLFKAMVDVGLEHGEGYVDYLWPKPTLEGLTSDQPKISYVKLFEPWNWIVGTGVYVDDIDREVDLKLQAVIDDLNKSIAKYKLDHDGYIYIFNDKAEIVVHPYLAGRHPESIENWLDGKKLFDDLLNLKLSDVNYLDYHWIKETDTINFIYEKRAYIAYFEPLGWYIASSYYLDNISKPINEFNQNLIYIIIALLAVSLLIAMVLASSLTRPLLQLSKSVSVIEKEGVPEKLTPVHGSTEIVNFSKVLNLMIQSVHETQKQQKESEEKLKYYIDFAPDPILILNKNIQVINYNKKAALLFKTTFDEGINIKASELIDTSSNCNIEESVKKIIQQGAGECEVIIIDQHKHKVKFLMSGVLLKNDDILIILKDITELKLIQEKLEIAKNKAEESNQLKSAFLANMSHEIRTPMNGIVGFSQLLNDPNIKEEERIEYSEIIEKNSMQLLRVVNDILDISKIETGQIELHKTKFDCVGLIDEMIKIYQKNAEKKGVEVQKAVNINSDLLLYADYTKVRQIIDNLLNNAVKFTEKGEITLGCSLYTEKVLFFVKDSGIGLSKEDANIIFDRFTQSNTNFNKGGTGLGLAISKAYIDLMQGEFWVESELHKGTIFYFTIPLST